MIDALYIATTGMQSGKSHIDTVSNNLANLNTIGFKKSQVQFADLLYREVPSIEGAYNQAESSKAQGMGSSVAAIRKVFDAGDLKATGNPLDVAISGKGFFEIILENGELAYTRDGSFQVNREGFLELSGNLLSSRVQMPADATEVLIQRDGRVSVKVGGGEAYDVGRIDLSYFLNEGDLESIGGGVYVANEKSGRALYSYGGTNGLGKLEQGFIESSNVDLVQELIELTIAQRAFGANSQVVRASDQIMQIINNLRQ